MGAFDAYEGTARCPACGAIHLFDGQTKVFDPDFGGLFMRRFAPGVTQPLELAAWRTLVANEWDDDWWRVRDRPEPGRLAVLLDFDEQRGCSCGRPLAAILEFDVDDAAPSATLRSLVLLDAISDDVAARVDLAQTDGMTWTRPPRPYLPEPARLRSAPAELRARWLREALALRFEAHERWLAPVDEDLGGWTHVIGPVCCEACGDTRERFVFMLLANPEDELSVLGDAWRGGVLRAGQRVEAAMGWRELEGDRGRFVRLRHPLPADTLTLCFGPETWGCGCGDERACVVLRFRVDEAGATLESLRLRVVRTPADLEDVDLSYLGYRGSMTSR